MNFFIFFVLLSFNVFAGTLSVKTAYESALTQNESIKIKVSEYNISEEKISQAFGKILPTLSLVGTYTRQDASSGLLSSTVNAEQWSTRANLTQPIFHGLSEFAQYRSLKARSRSQKALERQARLSLYATAASAYYDLLLAQTDLETLQLLIELTKKRVKDINQRTKIGRSKRSDRLSAEAQALNLTAQLEGAKANLRQAEETFWLTTGLSKPYELETPKALPEFNSSLSDLIKTLDSRPDILAAREESLAAEENIAVARGAHWPQIDFFGNYYFDRTGTLKDVKWDLGVTVTLPLFAGGTIQANVRESLEVYKTKTLNYSQAQRTAEKETRLLADTYLSSLVQYDALKEAAELSDQNYKEQNKDYKYGLVSNLEVLQAMNVLQETRRAMARTFFQALKTYAQLEASIGKNPFEKDPS